MLVIVGCEDYLEVKPRGMDVLYKTEHYDGLFNNTVLTDFAFSTKAWMDFGFGASWVTLTYNNDMMNVLMSDEFYCDEASTSGIALRYTEAGINAFRYNDDIFTVADQNATEWLAPYNHLYVYNTIINGVMDSEVGTDDEKNAIYNEARVMRAWMLFWAAQFWGVPYNEATAAEDLCVPIVTNADSQEADYPRATVKQVYTFIIDELVDAVPNLNMGVHKLRTYQPAGYYMLGMVYWMKGDYSNALTALNMCLDGVNDMEPATWYNYADIDYTWKGGTRNYSFYRSYQSDLKLNNEVFRSLAYSVSDFSSYRNAPLAYMKQSYLDLFSENDYRKNFFTDNPTGSVQYPGLMPKGRGNINMGCDLPGLYLMLAECEARVGSEANARNYLLTVRGNRMPASEAVIPASVTSRDNLIQFVVEERWREYMGTGFNWFDMRRLWNDPLFADQKEAYSHTDAQGTYLPTWDRLAMRIPGTVMKYHTDWENN